MKKSSNNGQSSKKKKEEKQMRVLQQKFYKISKNKCAPYQVCFCGGDGLTSEDTYDQELSTRYSMRIFIGSTTFVDVVQVKRSNKKSFDGMG